MARKRLNGKADPVASAAAPSPSPALEGDERWFRIVADFTYDWESWHGPDGRLVWVNPAVERMTGYSVEECLAMRDYPLPIVAEDDRPRASEVLELANRRESGDNVEFRIVHRSGETRWMSISWQPMYAEAQAGKKPSYLGFRASTRDVTERQKLREQLRLHAEQLEQLVQDRTERLRQLEQRQRQMEKLAALGQLAAGAAHEINNPLAGIRNAFALIKSDLAPDHEHFELLELIDREIERISNIVHQMYQLYRRNPQRSSEFALDRVIGEVTYLLASAANKAQVSVHWEAPAAPLQVLAPESEVKQVLFNIIRNAIQATPAGGVVRISTSKGDQEVSVLVQDQGPGIPEDVLSRIFDPFFSTKQRNPHLGMGLGLSVSRSLIEAMGGRIEVATGPGQGSRFSVTFPRRVETPQE